MADTAMQATRLLFLHAQTGLHPGSGTALGAVDLPVQRERHTQWPTIPGSALKGILRDLCREEAKGRHGGSRKDANEKDADLVAAFGPGRIDDSNAHAGALSLTDARLLAFPVRSLKGVFAWVTCPAVLERLNRDLSMAKIAEVAGPLPRPEKTEKEDEAHGAENGPLLVDGNKIVLEEFEFVRKAAADPVATWIAEHAVADEATKARVRTHLVVLSDDDFTHFVRHATEIVARIALNYDTKTVAGTALFYQEFLPAETLFYSVVFASESRYERPEGARGRFPNHRRLSAEQVMTYLGGHFGEKPLLLQIGGDETTGKGLCLACLSNGKES